MMTCCRTEQRGLRKERWILEADKNAAAAVAGKNAAAAVYS